MCALFGRTQQLPIGTPTPCPRTNIGLSPSEICQHRESLREYPPTRAQQHNSDTQTSEQWLSRYPRKAVKAVGREFEDFRILNCSCNRGCFLNAPFEVCEKGRSLKELCFLGRESQNIIDLKEKSKQGSGDFGEKCLICTQKPRSRCIFAYFTLALFSLSAFLSSPPVHRVVVAPPPWLHDELTYLHGLFAKPNTLAS